MFWFYLQLCLKYLLIQEEPNKIRSKIYIGLHVNYSLFWSDFNKTWISQWYFRKNTEISNFMKIRPVGAELFHANLRLEGQTNMAKITVAFCNLLSQFQSCQLLWQSWVKSYCLDWIQTQSRKKWWSSTDLRKDIDCSGITPNYKTIKLQTLNKQ
jgi:hypothetical protein